MPFPRAGKSDRVRHRNEQVARAAPGRHQPACWAARAGGERKRQAHRLLGKVDGLRRRGDGSRRRRCSTSASARRPSARARLRADRGRARHRLDASSRSCWSRSPAATRPTSPASTATLVAALRRQGRADRPRRRTSRRPASSASDYIEHYYDLGVLPRQAVGAARRRRRPSRCTGTSACSAKPGSTPSAPPKTIEELDAFAEKLTKWEVTLPDGKTEIRTRLPAPTCPSSQKRLLQVGFLPQRARLVALRLGLLLRRQAARRRRQVTADSPENVRAYEWVAVVLAGSSASTPCSASAPASATSRSPQNPFLSGKVAMELQGVWMFNFIEKYAPGMQWGAAPFPHPADRPDLRGIDHRRGRRARASPRIRQAPRRGVRVHQFVEPQEVHGDALPRPAASSRRCAR